MRHAALSFSSLTRSEIWVLPKQMFFQIVFPVFTALFSFILMGDKLTVQNIVRDGYCNCRSVYVADEWTEKEY